MQEPNILITGAAGYIGSHVAKLLSKKNFNTILLDDLSTGHKGAAKYGVFYEGSTGNQSLVEKIIQEHKISTVMHFAGSAIVEESIQNPLAYYSNNTANTISLLMALQKTNVKYFIFSSTCAVYGTPAIVPIPEECEHNPINPYGQSKSFIEKILNDLTKQAGLCSAVLRYFNAAGADPDGALGENHTPETHLIPRVLQACLTPNSKLTIYGGDYKTRDGTCIRDYIHVEDLAWAHLKAVHLLWDKNSFFDFNLGSEKGASVLEIIEATQKITGLKVPYAIGPRRIGDPPVLIAQSQKAKNLLGWKPQHDIPSIIKTAFDWEKTAKTI